MSPKIWDTKAKIKGFIWKIFLKTILKFLKIIIYVL